MSEIDEIQQGDRETGVRGQIGKLFDYFRQGSPVTLRSSLRLCWKSKAEPFRDPRRLCFSDAVASEYTKSQERVKSDAGTFMEVLVSLAMLQFTVSCRFWICSITPNALAVQ